MARIGITFDQVAAAADALVGEGQQPTISAVRERLGSGSPNTIHRHLTEWRQARPVAAAGVATLSATLTAAIASDIERAAAQARAEIESQLVEVQAEAAHLSTVGEAVEAERDGLIEQVAALTTERDTIAGKSAQQATDLAQAQQRIEREQQTAEAARIELATARLRIEAQATREAEQTAELERRAVALEAAQAKRIASEQEAAVLSAKLEAAAAQIRQQEQEAQRAVERQAGQSKEVERLRATFEAAQTARIAAEQQAAVLEARLEAAAAQLERQAQEAQREAERQAQLKVERDEAREHAAKLAGQLSAKPAPAPAPKAKS